MVIEPSNSAEESPPFIAEGHIYGSSGDDAKLTISETRPHSTKQAILECTPKLRHSDVEHFRSERRTANERVASVYSRIQEEGGRAIKGMYKRGGAFPRAEGIAWNPLSMAGQGRRPGKS